MKKAVDYLYELGHRKIGYITFSYKNQTTVKRRFEGYCEGLKKNKIKYNSDYVIIDDSIRLNEERNNYKIFLKLLK